jgi:hypothetical protein
MKKIGFVLALALVAAVAPAHATTYSNHRCAPVSVDYDVAGTLATTGALVANGDGTYSGTLTVKVSATNEHARADRGATKTYTLNHAHIKFGKGVSQTAPAAGSRVELLGNITKSAGKCPSFSSTTTIKKAKIHRA